MANFDQLVEDAYSFFERKEFHKALNNVAEAEDEWKNSAGKKYTDEEKQEIIASLENFKGFNYLAINNLELAKKAFENALLANPTSSQACAGLGEVFYLQEMDEEAKIMFEWAVDSNPNNQFALSGLAKVNRGAGLPEYHNTLNIDTTLKKREDFYRSITSAYKLFNEKKYDESLRKLQEVEKLFNKTIMNRETSLKFVSLENFKGFNYLALNNVIDAQECFERAININPNSSQACVGLGEVFFLQCKDSEAKAMFEWGLKNNPHNELAKANLAKVNKNLGYPENHLSMN